MASLLCCGGPEETTGPASTRPPGPGSLPGQAADPKNGMASPVGL